MIDREAIRRRVADKLPSTYWYDLADAKRIVRDYMDLGVVGAILKHQRDRGQPLLVSDVQWSMPLLTIEHKHMDRRELRVIDLAAIAKDPFCGMAYLDRLIDADRLREVLEAEAYRTDRRFWCAIEERP